MATLMTECGNALNPYILLDDTVLFIWDKTLCTIHDGRGTPAVSGRTSAVGMIAMNSQGCMRSHGCVSLCRKE